MSQVFYRKYRPKSFSEIQGQEFVKDILINSIITDNFSHGYLFSGPRGTGKTTTARLFARAINDPKFSESKDISKYLEDSIDIIEMDAASNRGIEEIRTLRDNIHYLPSELSYKVYIIDEAHMLTKEAFNALLKTLEEPPKHVVFILATTEPHKVPITILSRVTRIDFSLGSEDNIISKLALICKNEEINADVDVLKKIFRISGGSFRDSESILAKVASYSKDITSQLIDDIYGLLPEDKILQIVEGIIKSDIQTVVEIFNGVEESNLEILMESILSKLLEKNANPNLIEFFLDLLVKFKRVRDKKLFILAKLYTIKNVNNLKSVDTPIQKTASSADKSVPANDLETKVDKAKLKIEEVSKVETPKSASTNSNNDFTNLITEIAKDDLRLSSVLKSSDIEVEGSKVRVKNKYKFNIQYLSSPENKSKILTALYTSNSGIKDVELSFVQAESSSESKAKSDDKVSVNSEPEVKKEKSDNSKLVESLLL